MDDGLAAVFFSWPDILKVLGGLKPFETMVEAACAPNSRASGGDEAPEPSPEVNLDGNSSDGLSDDGPGPGHAAGLLQTAVAAHWAFVFGVCVHLAIPREHPPEERLRVAEYGLATSLITFWPRSQIPDGRERERLGVMVQWRGP
jgi:hypothetical protein